MNKLKQKIQDGTINIPGIIIKIALIWFIITFLVSIIQLKLSNIDTE